MTEAGENQGRGVKIRATRRSGAIEDWQFSLTRPGTVAPYIMSRDFARSVVYVKAPTGSGPTNTLDFRLYWQYSRVSTTTPGAFILENRGWVTFRLTEDNCQILNTFGPCEGFFRRSADRGWYILCLLYTSPSPRDRTRSRMPSSA